MDVLLHILSFCEFKTHPKRKKKKHIPRVGLFVLLLTQLVIYNDKHQLVRLPRLYSPSQSLSYQSHPVSFHMRDNILARPPCFH